jgi:hypothetical protein
MDLGRRQRDGLRAAALRGVDNRLHDLLIAQAFLARRMWPESLVYAAGQVVDL